MNKKYIRQYKWSHIFAMIRNQKRDPKIYNEKCKDKLVVITGGTSGIGKATALKYASMGCHVLTVNRNEEKSKKLCAEITSKYDVDCTYMISDFSKLEDIHNVANELSKMDRNIDVLIHNAGVYLTEKSFTEDNLEAIFQTNYLSTFILNYILKDKFLSQGEGRIIFVNSEAHRFAVWGMHLDDLDWNNHKYKGIKSYGSAKMAQLLSMLKFKELFANSNVTINAMHPGNVKTNSGSSNGRLYKFFKRNIVDRKARPIDISSEALYFLGVSDEARNITGKFFNLTTLEIPAPPALDIDEANRLWNISLDKGLLK